MNARRLLLVLAPLALVGCEQAAETYLEGEEVFEAMEDELTGMQSDAPVCTTSSTNSFAKVIDCRNSTLPPPPSIRRRFVRPQKNFSHSAAETDTSRIKAYTGRAHSGTEPQTYVLPTHRTSADGRLASAGTGLARFNPENLNLGFQTHADPHRRVLSHHTGLGYAFRIDPRPGKSRIPNSIISHPQAMNTGMFWETCNGSSTPEGETQMRRCRARKKTADPWIEGECYDLSMMWGNFSQYQYGVEGWWELRSTHLTVFIPKEKSVPTASQKHWQDGFLWFFPRADVAGLTDLPPMDDYAWPGPANPTWSYEEFVQVAKTQCGTGSSHKWCNYLNAQNTLTSESYRMYTGPSTYHLWNGKQGNTTPTFHGFLEPASTSDGRVLFIHDYGQGIMYSYNTVGPCDARGFRDFKPITQAYLDPNVNTKYGFARYPVRNTHGTTYPAGATVVGAYPWVDRKGNNLMFPVGDGMDGWKGKWVSNPGETSWPHHNVETKPEQVNQINAVGVVVLGSWTRGKMVVVDNGLNATDWSFSPYDQDFINHRFKVPLYRNGSVTEEVLIRPAGTSVVNSLENSLNQYNAMNPISPFDVVWVASSSQERNAEIVFDDYLRKGTRVVAHMNAAMRHFPTGRPEFPNVVAYDNGFEPTTSDMKVYKFRKSPKLQNATTMDNPATLDLRGGAWIPPVAEGGVLGRGVYLDGLNDHILVRKLPSRVNHFYLGLFVDQRTPSSTQFRTLYRFGDGSRVQLRKGAVQFVTPSGATVVKNLDGAAMADQRYFHLGLAFTRVGSTMKVKTFLDGTYISGDSTVHGTFDFAPPHNNTGSGGAAVCYGNPSSPQWQCQPGNFSAALCVGNYPITTTHCAYNNMVCSQNSIAAGGPPCVVNNNGSLVIGTDRAESSRPIRAYVNEFRFLDLSAGEANTHAFAELACNMAMGSLSAPGTPGSTCQQLDFRHHEPVDAEGIGTGLDFPVQAYTTLNCGSTVHRDGPGLNCGRAQAYGLHDKHLVANLPRPDFSQLSFCKSCHLSETDPVTGLRLSKLNPGLVPARDDPRRQPMSWFRVMTGKAPKMGSTYLAPYGQDWLNGTLDDVIDSQSPNVGPTRAGPY